MWGKFKKFIKGNKALCFFLVPLLRLTRSNQGAAIYDKLFSNVIGGSVKVSLKNIPGEFMVDARSHILKRILLTKEYEPEIVKQILGNINPHNDAINVGANIGLFTNLLANNINSNCKVLAIEPTPNAFKYLEENIESNGCSPRVVTFRGIAATKAGTYKLNIIAGNEEYSSIGVMVHPSTRNKKTLCVEVYGDTIDNLVLSFNLTPGIIVIDVEGAEFSVLKGSIETLSRFRPIIISEIDDALLQVQNSNSKQIFELLNEFGYIISDSKGDKIRFPFSGNIIARPR